MGTFYEVRIAKTAKRFKTSDDEFSVYDNTEKLFKTLDEAKEFIKETYKDTAKVSQMYIESENGAVKSGKIYQWTQFFYKEKEKSTCQDWVTIYEMTSKIVPY